VRGCRKWIEGGAHKVGAIGGDGHSLRMWLKNPCLEVVLSLFVFFLDSTSWEVYEEKLGHIEDIGTLLAGYVTDYASEGAGAWYPTTCGPNLRI
jgi:hypothetical protein